jgi:hypothetical protein
MFETVSRFVISVGRCRGVYAIMGVIFIRITSWFFFKKNAEAFSKGEAVINKRRSLASSQKKRLVVGMYKGG